MKKQEAIKVLILSTSEAKNYAIAVNGLLEEEDYNTTVWYSGNLFKPSHSTLSAIENFNSYDYAIVILSPDDKLTKRGEEKFAPRDNLIFELGFCYGVLGKERVFFLTQKGVEYALPSDLNGITAIRYSHREDKPASSIMTSPCQKIREFIVENEKHPKFKQAIGSDNVTFWHSISDRRLALKDVPSLINKAEKRIIIIGIALKFIAQHCWGEIFSALTRGVKIAIVLIPDEDSFKDIYWRFSSSNNKEMLSLKDSLEIYDLNRQQLPVHLKQNFGIYNASFPFMQSIGIYDDLISVSPLCIGGDKGISPSFEMTKLAKSHNNFHNEIKEIFLNSNALFDSPKPTELGII